MSDRSSHDTGPGVPAGHRLDTQGALSSGVIVSVFDGSGCDTGPGVPAGHWPDTKGAPGDTTSLHTAFSGCRPLTNCPAHFAVLP